MIYADLGLEPIINAAGDVTRLGGTLMLPEVRRAMDEAAQAFVPISELQKGAGRVIAEMTGAESGYITCGASAGLALSAAACIAGQDPVAISRLPDASGRPHDVLMLNGHRDAYDRCLRLSGARVISVGSAESATIADLVDAIGPETAAVAWFATHQRAGPPLADIAAAAHAHGIPVIVDAAMSLPPAENLRRFVQEGADLVAFSAGKALRGPQAAGILAGRADLIASVAMQNQDMGVNPRFLLPGAFPDAALQYGPLGQGLGRPMKVGKEEIVGAIVALQLYARRDHASELATWQSDMRVVAENLQGIAGVQATYVFPLPDGRPLPTVRVAIDQTLLGTTASEVFERLAAGRPRVFVSEYFASRGVLSVHPVALQPGEAVTVSERLRALLVERLTSTVGT
jgi:D-glucosaminate-6-phosphate ammonia-lyase